jgi:hypothetical protein
MQIDQVRADNRIFNVDRDAIKRGLAMTPEQRLLWAEEMMILGWEVQARIAKLANEKTEKVPKNLEDLPTK